MTVITLMLINDGCECESCSVLSDNEALIGMYDYTIKDILVQNGIKINRTNQLDLATSRKTLPLKVEVEGSVPVNVIREITDVCEDVEISVEEDINLGGVRG